MRHSNVTRLEVHEGGRQPPVNLQAEQSLLAAILAANHTYEDVAEFLKPEHFGQPVHGEIFKVCGQLIEQGRRADGVTLRNLFNEHEELVEVGGPDYLAGLQANYVSLLHAEDYGRQVHGCYLRRELMAAGLDIERDAFEFEADPTDLLDRSEARLESIRDGSVTGHGLRRLGDVMDSTIAQIEEARRRRSEGLTVGLSTGLYGLDHILAGLHPGHLTIIAGRPAMGKTALALGMAHGAACSGANVAFFSLEMTAEELNQRLLTLRTGISADKIKAGDITDQEAERLYSERAAIETLPITILDDDNMTVSSMRAAARSYQRKQGLDCVIIDYLQLMEGEDSRYRENRTQEVTAITRGLKRMAKSLGVPVVALSQLNRALEARDDKRPHLGDLRESGSIEQDADEVLFVFREEYYLTRDQPQQKSGEKFERFEERLLDWRSRLAKVGNKAELIVAKNRHGRTGTVTVDCHLDRMRFSDEGSLY